MSLCGYLQIGTLAIRGQKRALSPPELELQAVESYLMWVLGTSEAMCAFNLWDISPALICAFLVASATSSTWLVGIYSTHLRKKTPRLREVTSDLCLGSQNWQVTQLSYSRFFFYRTKPLNQHQHGFTALKLHYSVGGEQSLGLPTSSGSCSVCMSCGFYNSTVCKRTLSLLGDRPFSTLWSPLLLNLS